MMGIERTLDSSKTSRFHPLILSLRWNKSATLHLISQASSRFDGEDDEYMSE